LIVNVEDALKIIEPLIFVHYETMGYKMHNISFPFKTDLFLKHKNATGRCKG